MLKQRSQQHVPRPEIAIRLDYFWASMDGRCGDWEGGLSRIDRHYPMYEMLLHEIRYRDLFTLAKIDLLLGRNQAADDDVANSLLEGIDPSWNPETGFQPYHAYAVISARVRARKRASDFARLLENALNFLDAEIEKWPFGLDVAFSRVAAAAAEIECSEAAGRAGDSAARYRARRTAAARDLAIV